MERKVFTHLEGDDARPLNDALARIGFRRNQDVAYRPDCDFCASCIPVRVVADHFRPTTTQRRLMRRNAALVEMRLCPPRATDEQYQLLMTYLAARHSDGDGAMAMSRAGFGSMVEKTHIDTYVAEYRTVSSAHHPGRLVGACLMDVQEDGLSMVYSFYATDPDAPKGMGTYMILEHIARAKRAGVPYVYLGYWIKACARMNYKAGFSPLERLCNDGWHPLDRNDPDLSGD